MNPYPVVCDLVAKKIFLDTRDLKEWKRTCNHRSRLVTPYSKKELILKDINNVLALLKVSHLEIYDASEVKSIWQGENKETGINGEFIDSELVIFKVHPRSPAENLGFKKGDVIVSINGEQPSSWSVENEGGDYQIHRGPEEFTIKMIPGTVHRDDSMHVTTIGKNARLLEIPSFRADFFKGSALKTVAADLKGASTVVVDLRGNAGGNFVAGLRLLSMFICEPTEIGKLVKPKSTAKTKSLMPNDLDDVRQLAVLEANHEVVLKTFKQEGCFAGAVKVLVDGKSSSVAEMVAQGLKEFRKSPVRGTPSRGQLLVGVWYPIDEIAQGVQISIPEALYVSAKGRRIEGQGVELEKTLYYNLPEMQAGIDSWVKSFLD
ncbi:MAG: PDZ domain-containing protein [Bdellovibrio sp.]|nr:PDZ domain-containing protein [Bdellovibrio sp.]